MKKILYIGNNLPNENPTSLVLLSNLLKKQGYSVISFSNKTGKTSRLLHMCWGLLKNRKTDFVLIDTYSTLNFYYALIISQLCRFFSIRYIPILRGGNLPNRFDSTPKLCQLIFKNAYNNVVLSNYLLNELKKYGYPTVFIPNIIQLKNYSLRKRMRLKPKLLWVRAFDKMYNPEMAIKALFEIRKILPNASLCMVGPDKGCLDSVKSLSKKLGVFESVIFTGKLLKEQWHQLSEDYDIFLNTTTIDNTPVSVIESMALGLTVISTNVGGMPYLIDDGVDGVLVDKSDYKAMAHQIIHLIEKNNQLLAVNARKKVEKFDSAVVVKSWMKLLN